ncbi:hypothetical protein [Flectobacillus longus]|uniref:hypothetical protein n=1 Tax=Flectobacillus longus TaxID=2984207 RepID=UPI0024B65A88|nr:hypothetical protein [Flectobacillus longus]MDI9878055.1 hypothetical protein [Flectobacillus longus]
MPSSFTSLEQRVIQLLGDTDYKDILNEIKALPKLIFQNEPMEVASKVCYRKRIGLLIVTNVRAVFVEDNSIEGLNAYEFQFSEIQNITVNSVSHEAFIQLSIGNRIELFENIPYSKAQQLVAVINTKIRFLNLEKDLSSSKGTFSSFTNREKEDVHNHTIDPNKEGKRINILNIGSLDNTFTNRILLGGVGILLIMLFISYVNTLTKKDNIQLAIDNQALINNSVLSKNDTIEAYNESKSKQVEEKKIKDFIKKVKKNYKVTYDDIEKIHWVYDSSNPINVTKNGFFVYFGMTESNFWPRIKIQYFGDDWLFVKSYSFKIYDSVIDYQPRSTVNRDNDSGYVWETLDESPEEDVQLDTIWHLLAGSGQSKIRFKGDRYYKDKIISSNQVKSLKKMRSLYEEAKEIYGIKPKQY